MSQTPSNGIDIREAIEILSQRQADGHVHESITKEGGTCCNHHLPNEHAKDWGQRIDICPETIDQGEEEKEEIEKARIARRDLLEDRMNNMSKRELIACVISSQADRVVAYRAYDRGLEEVLRSGELHRYPQICAEATATFSVLSDTINSVRQALKDRDSGEVCDLIATLQKNEKTKLSLTAALHLEKVRATSERDESPRIANGATLSDLHNRDIQSLKQGIGTAIDEINDTLEELRFFSEDAE